MSNINPNKPYYVLNLRLQGILENTEKKKKTDRQNSNKIFITEYNGKKMK